MSFDKLPTTFLPKKYQHILLFQDVIDRAYCFFSKNHIRCSVISLQSLYNQLVMVTELQHVSDWRVFSMSKLELLCSFCPTEFMITQSTDVTIFSYKQYLGVGKASINSRRKLLITAMWEYVRRHLTVSQGNDSVVPDSSFIKKHGWSEQHSIEQCPYPNDTYPNTTNSIINSQVNLSNPSQSSSSSWLMVKETLTSPEEEAYPTTTGKTTNNTFHHLLDYLKQSPFYSNQIKYIHTIPPKQSIFQSIEPPLSPFVHQRLQQVYGIQDLYRHQALGIQAIRQGKHVMVTTATASGKSFIFNIPVIESIQQHPQETVAIYLFPTKALAQDQYRSIMHFLNASSEGIQNDNAHHEVVPVVCDGDTSLGDRLAIRQGMGNVILTNPDMLHYTLLPEHKAWSRIFKHLKYIVIDEAHIYNGVFGCHVANVFRRLLRLCVYYQTTTKQSADPSRSIPFSLPQFICCSATMNQPLEQFRRLIPLDVLTMLHNLTACPSSSNDADRGEALWEIIGTEMDGAPHGAKTFVIWNPYETSVTQVIASTDNNKIQGISVNASSLLDQTASSPATATTTTTQSSKSTTKKSKISKLASSTNINADAVVAANTLLLPVINDRLQQHRSILMETAKVIAGLIQCPPEDNISPYRIIAFCRTRKIVELVYKYASSILESTSSSVSYGKDLASKLVSYRGGYHKDERRAIESKLFNHQLLGVVTTCALELGIDVGSLDISVHLGFPGSLSSLYQQMGRVGRSLNKKAQKSDDTTVVAAASSINNTVDDGSLSILICFDCPIDQYFCKHPEILFQPPPPVSAAPSNAQSRNSDAMFVDQSNIFILKNHLMCAAQELPLNTLFTLPLLSSSSAATTSLILDHYLWTNNNQLTIYEEAIALLFETYKLRPTNMNDYLAYVKKQPNIKTTAENEQAKWLKTLWSYWPQGTTTNTSTSASSSSYSYSKQEAVRTVNLRLIDPLTIQVLNDSTGQIIDSIEYSRAFFELYTGAILLQQGQQYLITKLDLVSTTAHAIPVKEPYYTSALNTTMVNIVKILSFNDDIVLNEEAKAIPMESIDSPNKPSVVTTDDTNMMLLQSMENMSPSKAKYTKRALSKAIKNEKENINQPPQQQQQQQQQHLFHYGIVQVVMKVDGYRKLRLGSGETFEYGECSLPPLEYETQGFWIDLPTQLIQQYRGQEERMQSSIHALNHVLLTASALLSSGVLSTNTTSSSCSNCDFDLQSNDLATEHIFISSSDSIRTAPYRIMLYDKNPGGLGICGNLYQSRYALLSLANKILNDCTCIDGCPTCILDSRCSAHNNYIDKEGAKKMISYLINHMSPSSPSTSFAQECCGSPSSPLLPLPSLNQSHSQPHQNILGINCGDNNNANSPRKRKRQQSLQKVATTRSSERATKMTVQPSWSKSIPDFVTEELE